MESGDGNAGKRAFSGPVLNLDLTEIKGKPWHVHVTHIWQIKTNLSIVLSTIQCSQELGLPLFEMIFLLQIAASCRHLSGKYRVVGR